MSHQDLPSRTTLFVKTGCPHCAIAREYLAAHQIEFLERNVTEDREALVDMKRFSGQDRTPTLVLEGDVLSDFDLAGLASFLEQHGVHATRE